MGHNCLAVRAGGTSTHALESPIKLNEVNGTELVDLLDARFRAKNGRNNGDGPHWGKSHHEIQQLLLENHKKSVLELHI
jgi:hypothetical protein